MGAPPRRRQPWHWLLPTWNDRRVELETVRRLNAGAIRPRQWGWKPMGPYNGSSGHDRVVGWQKIWAAVELKLMPAAKLCSVCGSREQIHYHSEDYLRPIDCRPICSMCHMVLHKRFERPRAWFEIAFRHGQPGDWFYDLRMRERTAADMEAERQRLFQTPLDDCSTPYHGCGIAVVYPGAAPMGFIPEDEWRQMNPDGQWGPPPGEGPDQPSFL